MKKLIILSIILTAFLNAYSQSDTTKYEYAELLGYQGFLTKKVTVSIDYGQATKYFQDTRLRDQITGEFEKFNSMVDAMNYMGKDGWEFVQAYAILVGQQNVYHWMLKRPLKK